MFLQRVYEVLADPERRRLYDETGSAKAMRRAMLGTGRGIVVAGLTTAGAFLILAVSPDPVFYRLGLAGDEDAP